MSKKVFIGSLCAAALAALGGCVPREIPPGMPKAKAAEFALSSDAFQAGGEIPAGYTCDGRNLSPELSWKNVPAGAKSLALVVRDPDAPSGDFLHWAVVDIPPGVSQLAAGARPPAPSRELANDAGTAGYTGPCPPSGRHRYVFTLYALSTDSFAAGQARLEDYLDARALGKAVLTALYQRTK
jgi:hypothetical protein